jgi:hypothetical protein
LLPPHINVGWKGFERKKRRIYFAEWWEMKCRLVIARMTRLITQKVSQETTKE